MRKNLKWSPNALCEFEKLDVFVANRISDRVEYLAKNIDNVDIKPLKGHWYGHYRYAVGDWRIIFAVYEDTIVIKSVGHRKNIYK
ncbi:MAG: type II toxin-antitoxin system RelE/ParE family toxin [Nitrospirae bacterium]|nr:type II toxin-antitoxin system RelE/ParE family toxin [Nitrospirota bacterium]